MQAFHGYEIRLASNEHKNYVVWTVIIPETGFTFSGRCSAVVAMLKGYQAGYQAGRKYTDGESRALKAIIEEAVSA